MHTDASCVLALTAQSVFLDTDGLPDKNSIYRDRFEGIRSAVDRLRAVFAVLYFLYWRV